MRDPFKFHGFQGPPRASATRHTILILLAFYDVWKQEKAKYQFTGGFDPKAHFHKPTLLADLADAVAPIIKKRLSPEEVYAHLLYLSELKHSDSDTLVRNHPGAEKPGEPIYQLGKAGEDLCDALHNRDLRCFIEGDAKYWQPVLIWGRMAEAGECSPENWTPDALRSLTALNRGQISKALKMLTQGFTARTRDGAERVFQPGSVVNTGTAKFPIYEIAAQHRTVGNALPDFDFEEEDEATPPEPSNGKTAAAAAAFADTFGIGDDEDTSNMPPANLPEVDDLVQAIEEEFPPAAEPVGARANVSDEDVDVLQAEASRRKISLDSLVTLILKAGIEEIRRVTAEREVEEARLRQEEQALLAEMDEVEARLAAIRGRRTALVSGTNPAR